MSILLGPVWTDVSGPTTSPEALFRRRSSGITEPNHLVQLPVIKPNTAITIPKTTKRTPILRAPCTF